MLHVKELIARMLTAEVGTRSFFCKRNVVSLERIQFLKNCHFSFIVEKRTAKVLGEVHFFKI